MICGAPTASKGGDYCEKHSNADAAYKKAVLDPLTEIFDKFGKSLDMENKSDD